MPGASRIVTVLVSRLVVGGVAAGAGDNPEVPTAPGAGEPRGSFLYENFVRDVARDSPGSK